MQSHIKAGRAHIVQGDALVLKDVEKAWETAKSHRATGVVDSILFTVGGFPSFSLTKGIVMDPPNLVTQCLLNVLCTVPTSTLAQPEGPRIIAISSTGLTKTSHKSLPLAWKPLYGYLLAEPHKDKVGAERAVAHCAGWSWNSKEDGEPGDAIMGGSDWASREGLPQPGTLKNVLIIRPALLTDGKCCADQKGRKAYRVSTEELGSYTVSRRDVAHFVAEAITSRWDEFKGKCVNIGY